MDQSVPGGQTVRVPVTVHDFDNILGMQFSINYNSNILTYTGAQSFNTDLIGLNIGSVGNPSPGNITFTWKIGRASCRERV